MRLLIITYSYPPDLTPRAFRWSSLVDQFASMGHEIHVVCAAAPGVVDSANGVTVHRTRDWFLNGSMRVTPPAAGSGKAGGNQLWGSMRSALRKAARTIWRALYWPDFACGWVVPASRAARALCRGQHFDWIISSSHPFTGHVVGMLTKISTPTSRWLVDISDPFCLMKEPSPNNSYIYARPSFFFESHILAKADAVSVTTDSTARLYTDHFPIVRGKLRVIPPILSLPPIPSPSPRHSGDAIRLVFVGTLYRKLRSPRFLLSCFSALVATQSIRRMELHFYGTINDCAGDLDSCPGNVKSALFAHGLVERSKVLQAMVDADVLINIGNDSEAQLASKVIEYMAVGKPILNIVSLDNDTSAQVLADYPAAITIRRFNEGPSAEVVEDLVEFILESPHVSEEYIEGVRRLYAPNRVADLYASILERSVA